MVSPTSTSITISCHCGAARQTLSARGSRGVFSDASFCHCSTCRRTTGLLCASYAPVSPPPATATTGLEAYALSPTTTAYFCSTCGCHVFRARRPSAPAGPGEREWEVATGTITHERSDLPEQWRHRHVRDTKDGGLAVWLPAGLSPLSDGKEEEEEEEEDQEEAGTVDNDDEDGGGEGDTLPAACHCGSIGLRITRPAPKDSPLNPDSGYPDLLLAYASTSPVVVANPAHERWYLRSRGPRDEDEDEDKDNNEPGGRDGSSCTYYLAGTCACPSCRLTSGFEIQTWAFIPRRNILIHHQTRSEVKGNGRQPVPLDFAALPPGTPLRQYESSPGRMREFCARCGATVFWHDKFRPDLIDVSVGLLRAEGGDRGGARAENWLEWWTGRVSFSEQAGEGRTGAAKAWGERVIQALEEGMGRAHRRHERHRDKEE
ncbi:Mss4-like protein [Thermothelomyces heterothallicus CBS 202.75]|uniref:Mss4-like protein n=1 Tax=Thermothelomyces heterothallicus CBS 202.75 TaxID=1149848 RepID=UPI0037424ECC